MLKFRDYTPQDGDLVASWVTDEWTLRVWAVNCYRDWPVSGEEISRLYASSREKEPSFRPLMAEEDGVPVGHMTMQYTDPEKTMVHFGFVILDPACRGRGLGSRLLRMAMEKAFCEMDAQGLDLLVLDCNERAWKCYLALGFTDVPDSAETTDIAGRLWVRHKMELHREKSPAAD